MYGKQDEAPHQRSSIPCVRGCPSFMGDTKKALRLAHTTDNLQANTFDDGALSCSDSDAGQANGFAGI